MEQYKFYMSCWSCNRSGYSNPCNYEVGDSVHIGCVKCKNFVTFLNLPAPNKLGYIGARWISNWTKGAHTLYARVELP